MKLIDWPAPVLIPFLTPSGFVNFRSCALKAVLSRSADYKEFIYLHPKGRIGTVCHKILEKFSRGEFDHSSWEETVRQIESMYRLLCNEQFVLANQSIYKESFGSPEEWPGYYIRLERLKIIGKKLLQVRDSFFVRTSRQIVEQNINEFNGKLKGRPDRYVFISPNELLIEDYKSGLIYDEELNLSEGIKQQMLLYSAIIHRIYPNIRIRYRVIPFKGPSYEESVDFNEANALVQEAIKLLDDINSVLEGIASSTRTFDELANPSLENCVNCPFKFRCNRFLRQNFQDLRYISIKGKLKEVKEEDDFVQIAIASDSESRILLIRRLSGEKFSFLKTVNHDTSIILTELQKDFEDDKKIIFTPTFKTNAWHL